MTRGPEIHGSMAARRFGSTGSYDPDLNLTYWGIGNPGPDYNADGRAGDNLYSDSVVALDADTGKLKWHFQFTPHDVFDYDSVQIPVLADIAWQGRTRKVMLWANRNGFFYVLDSTNGEFLLGKPFEKVTWATGLDPKGRPILAPGAAPTPEGTRIYPGVQGATNWYSPSFSPRTGLFYIPTWVGYYSTFTKYDLTYEPGQRFTGGTPRSVVPGVRGVGYVNTRREEDGSGAIRAIDPQTGDRKWEFKLTDVTDSGILTTASDLLFTGSRDGSFYAIDAKTGAELWRAAVGGQVVAGPMTYRVVRQAICRDCRRQHDVRLRSARLNPPHRHPPHAGLESPRTLSACVRAAGLHAGGVDGN